MTLRRPASRQARLALCLVAVGSGTIVPCAAAGPRTAYWSDNWRGWHFYEEPEIPSPNHRLPHRGKAAPASSAATATPAVARQARDRRVRAPAEAPRGAPAHRHHAADRSQRTPLHGARGQVVRAHPPSPTWRSASHGPRPELDPTLQGRPVNAKALEVFDQLQTAQRSQSISALGRDHVLFFFFRSDCPYCHAFAPTLEAFQARHGIQVVAISVDGGPMPGFPDAGATTASPPRCG
jgi:conjugal transfer pilus assembly protein TraF